MTPRQTRRAFRKFGVPFRELPDARTHNRNHVGPFDDVVGVVIHHTGDDAPDERDRAVIHDGRADLAGPLAHTGGRDDGVVEIVSFGRANHAGGGDPRVLAAVRAESYGKYPPAPHEHTGSAGAVDGNSHLYGHETYYSGAKAPTRKAYRSAVLMAAARCDFHGWSARSVIGHKEWSDWKSDPGNVDMFAFRRDVQRVLDAADDPALPAASTDPIEGWTRMLPIRDRLAELLTSTRNRDRRRRISAALAEIEGTRS